MKRRACPEYRVRLFQSVDLVGSTAFKARYDKPDGDDPNPVWVNKIKKFYKEFPRLLAKNYYAIAEIDADIYKDCHKPEVWKTVGDEIIFSCRAVHIEHLALCVSAFIRSLADYGQLLADENQGLDVKGTGWLAAFPAPNITVNLQLPFDDPTDLEPSKDQPDEEDEDGADRYPSRFDFLGKHIDAGFRSSKFSASDAFSCSMELSYHLSVAAGEGLFRYGFFYHGRHVLKGVIDNKPYPLFSLDVERSPSKRAVRDHERDITQLRPAESRHVRIFLEKFAEEEKVEMPVLARAGRELTMDELPEDYRKWKAQWEVVNVEIVQREKGEKEAAEADVGGENELSPLITYVLKLQSGELVRRALQKSSKNEAVDATKPAADAATSSAAEPISDNSGTDEPSSEK